MIICRWLYHCNIDVTRMDESVLKVMVEYSRCTKSRKDYVRYEDGEHMARELGASGYMECSAVSREGLEEVFEAACQWTLGGDAARRGFQKQCDKNTKTIRDAPSGDAVPTNKNFEFKH